ncbi:DEKNAAC102233 [Brettanomyces naardenensis]|uniref:LSM2-LSM8 complex subunit LSM8 n=1 Tax=Brettanomyces naardenensis TaxID=13370 RepID=A0A448YLE0_BRENA|nr:DEKNAAC102233 [Brettanomyces naardenensis]
MSTLKPFLNEKVKVLTADGRLLLGVLEGFDRTTNLVLSSAKERIFSIDEPTKDISMGLCIVRGNEVVSISDYDEQVEDSTDYSKIFAEKLKDTRNSLID